MNEQEMRSIFLLAGLPVERAWRLENRYENPGHIATLEPEFYPAEHRVQMYDRAAKRPWWLAKTPIGLVEFGWRKRVIAIDWSETGIKAQVTPDDVTKDDTSVHAWSTVKAVEYLTSLAAKAQLKDSDSSARVSPEGSQSDG